MCPLSHLAEVFHHSRLVGSLHFQGRVVSSRQLSINHPRQCENNHTARIQSSVQLETLRVMKKGDESAFHQTQSYLLIIVIVYIRPH